MITKTFKTLNGKLRVSIPTQLNEITLGQLMAMQSETQINDLDAISILSGVPLAQLQSIKNYADLQQFNTHVAHLAVQITRSYDSESLPKEVSFDIAGQVKTVKVIINLGVEPAGAFLAARDVISDEISGHIAQHGEENWKESFNPSLNACALVLAHYFYVPVTGKSYDEYQAEGFLQEIKKLPFIDALPVAKYFFLNYPNLSKPRISSWLRVLLLWKRRLALNSFKNSGTLTQ